MAKALDNKTRSVKSAEWRQYVVGKNGGCGKGAYDYAKGPSSLMTSPMVDAMADDEEDPGYTPDIGDSIDDRAPVHLDGEKTIYYGISLAPSVRTGYTVPNSTNGAPGGDSPLGSAVWARAAAKA
jgi:hypothetical protein